MDVKAARCAVQRATLERLSWFALHVMEDDSQSTSLRDEAHDLLFILNEIMCHRFDLGLERVVLPAGCAEFQYYTEFVNDLVIDLYGSDEPQDFRSVTILLARRAAEYVDDALYTNAFRMECYEVLVELVDAIRQQAADAGTGTESIDSVPEQDYVDDDGTDDDTTAFERGYNYYGTH
jgi:hypothetical protein